MRYETCTWIHDITWYCSTSLSLFWLGAKGATGAWKRSKGAVSGIHKFEQPPFVLGENPGWKWWELDCWDSWDMLRLLEPGFSPGTGSFYRFPSWGQYMSCMGQACGWWVAYGPPFVNAPKCKQTKQSYDLIGTQKRASDIHPHKHPCTENIRSAGGLFSDSEVSIQSSQGRKDMDNESNQLKSPEM